MRKAHIFLIGFMGCGKSTVADCLCRSFGLQQIEMDRKIEEKEGRSISCIFQKEGESYFRTLETELLKSLGETKNCVVSCGGGVPLKEENVKIMKEMGTVVLLSAEPGTIYERVKKFHHRPLLENRMNEPAIRQLMEERKIPYENAADFLVKTDGRSVDEICREIMEQIKKEGTA